MTLRGNLPAIGTSKDARVCGLGHDKGNRRATFRVSSFSALSGVLTAKRQP